MYNYPKSIRNLIDSLKKLPSIGEKSAERMALAILEEDKEQVEFFANSLIDVKNKIKRCVVCNNFSEDDICEICSDKNRKQDIICVVEYPKNIIMFEKTESFSGKYHVLNGLISPLDGVTPEDINIKSLVERVKNENIKEIIIAVKPSIEGETTALYISKLFEDTSVLVSKIAHGVPLGTDMDYIDTLTLELALEDRKKISN